MQGEVENVRHKDIEKSISYGFTLKERVFYFLIGELQIVALSYIFYKSIVVIVFLQLLLPFYMKIKESECRAKHINILKAEFKEMLEVFQTSISAGFSPENSIKHTRDEMRTLGYGSGIVARELEFMLNKFKLNVPVSDMFMDWGRRSRLRDIEDFVQIFNISGKTGGNTVQIIKDSAKSISEKIEVERDIATILAARKYEQKIINAIPLFILLYVDFSSKGFLTPLYSGLVGRGIMTICLLVYLSAYRISAKIMDIEV